MLIKPKAGQAAKIKVVGIGGGGGNAINSMIKEGGISGVEFVAVNTDSQALLTNKASIKLQIGEELTRGLGSGGDPEVGQQAVEESRDRIKEEIEGADMVFLTCGMGGGTGTGATPVIAEIAKELGILTVAVVTKPFAFEGSNRMMVAEEGTSRLEGKVDTLIVVPNQKILKIIDKKTPILEAFKKIDSILHQGVKGIAELITLPGLINVDFADVRTIMKNAGSAIMGMGIGSGEKRGIEAIKQAISSPLLDLSLDGAKGVLFNVVGGPDLSLVEVDEAASVIAKAADPDADIIFGAVIDQNMMDQVKITLIATRFGNSKLKLFRFRKTSPMPTLVNKGKKKTGDKEKEEDKEKSPDLSAYDEEDVTDEDSEFDIPAFLRRKK